MTLASPTLGRAQDVKKGDVVGVVRAWDGGAHSSGKFGTLIMHTRLIQCKAKYIQRGGYPWYLH